MKIKLLIASLLIGNLCMANPAPFGFELGQMSVREFKEKGLGNFEGVNEWSKGDMYTLLPQEINFAGIKDVTLIFDKDEILVAVLTVLEKDKFFSLFNLLQKNYTLLGQDIPYVGNRTASFFDGDVQINLRSPRMGCDMYMEYVTKDFVDSF